MKHRLVHIIIFMQLTLCLMPAWLGCSPSTPELPNPQRSAYFWKTVYSNDSLEQAFVHSHGIRKLYIRYFDVILTDQNRLKPNATIRFLQPPDTALQIVPTVFIVEKCLYHNPDTLAKTLVDRILQISETHHVANVHEIQIDCDWTRKSQDLYFGFLQSIRDYCGIRGLRLSVTIRLHQLSMTPPPCDYGVLMLYNTGNVRDPRIANPILGYSEVRQYIGRISNYRLPLCAALPNFKWQMLSGHGNFKSILYNLDMADSSMYHKVGADTYVALRNKDVARYMSDESYNVMINRGDTIKLRKAEFSEIEKVCADIRRLRPGVLRQVIIYDLNNYNINNLTTEEYEKIFDFCDGVSRR